MNIEKRMSSIFMIANLIATIFIIMIHYNSMSYINVSINYNFNYYVQQFFANGIGRISVPVFALLSGFFIYENILTFNKYRDTLYKKIHTVILPYILGSLIIFLIVIIIKVIANKIVINQILEFSYLLDNILLHPYSVQFWFLRDLIILIIVSPIIFNLKKELSLLLGLCLFFYGFSIFNHFQLLKIGIYLMLKLFFTFLLEGR